MLPCSTTRYSSLAIDSKKGRCPRRMTHRNAAGHRHQDVDRELRVAIDRRIHVSLQIHAWTALVENQRLIFGFRSTARALARPAVVESSSSFRSVGT